VQQDATIQYSDDRCCQILISVIYEYIKTATTTITTLFLMQGELSIPFGYTLDPKT
jgi:hypothetical protein